MSQSVLQSDLSDLKVFGIRHHGPGSARSLVRSLSTLNPDIILVEGPPEATDTLSLLASEEMKPPVALLLYPPDHLQLAVYYPFAIFSPEWQAIQYGLKQNIPVQFMDLPQTHQLAERVANQAEEGSEALEKTIVHVAGEPTERSLEQQIILDPLSWLAEAAGYTDSERWWEHLVEQRREDGELFEAILEAMAALRQEISQVRPTDLDDSYSRREAQREAYMRQTIRKAQKAGYQKIAAVCGAWHAPALSQPFPAQKDDRALLKGLPKLKVKATWIPWTYARLSRESGYGAGIASPGWYEHLWKSSRFKASQSATRWLTRVARLLRKEDLDASSASVIEAVRLAEALAALRDAAMPGLDELTEATRTVLCFGDETPLKLIRQKLIVCDRLGKVPTETPLVPLQQNLQQRQKKLRLKPEAEEKVLTLDLRKELDLARSHLLNRLSLLNINWGKPQRTSSKGTFKEAWKLKWRPELSIAIIEAGRWGNTVSDAASAFAVQTANDAPNLPALTQLLSQVLLSNLPEAVTHLLQQLQSAAAVASDVSHLMEALPPLANILRYRDVRQTDSSVVAQVVDGLIARICIGLPGACASLDDDAAAKMLEAIEKTHRAVKLIQNERHQKSWSAALRVLCDSSTERLRQRDNLHGLISGRCCRLLLDEGSLQSEEVARRLRLALSVASEPAQAAAWVEGFLQGSGLLLLHDDKIWQVLDDWVISLSTEAFVALLPLLRRTFSSFSPAERRQMGERSRRGLSSIQPVDRGAFDLASADASLPLVVQLLGLPSNSIKQQS